MSLYAFQSSLFDLCPRVWVERDRLCARSSWLQRALTLFSYERFVYADRRLKVVFVERRYLWFLRSSRSVRFSRIRHIDYRFSKLWTSYSGIVGPTDQLEKFAVVLVLRDPDEELALFRFRGLGSIGTGWLGVLLGDDDIVDLEGTQQSASLAFAEALHRLLGVSLGETPLALSLARQRGWQCTACKRPSLPRAGKCTHCGSPVAPSSPPPA